MAAALALQSTTNVVRAKWIPIAFNKIETVNDHVHAPPARQQRGYSVQIKGFDTLMQGDAIKI